MSRSRSGGPARHHSKSRQAAHRARAGRQHVLEVQVPVDQRGRRVVDDVGRGPEADGGLVEHAGVVERQHPGPLEHRLDPRHRQRVRALVVLAHLGRLDVVERLEAGGELGDRAPPLGPPQLAPVPWPARSPASVRRPSTRPTGPSRPRSGGAPGPRAAGSAAAGPRAAGGSPGGAGSHAHDRVAVPPHLVEHVGHPLEMAGRLGIGPRRAVQAGGLDHVVGSEQRAHPWSIGIASPALTGSPVSLDAR